MRITISAPTEYCLYSFLNIERNPVSIIYLVICHDANETRWRYIYRLDIHGIYSLRTWSLQANLGASDKGQPREYGRARRTAVLVYITAPRRVLFAQAVHSGGA